MSIKLSDLQFEKSEPENHEWQAAYAFAQGWDLDHMEQEVEFDVTNLKRLTHGCATMLYPNEFGDSELPLLEWLYWIETATWALPYQYDGERFLTARRYTHGYVALFSHMALAQKREGEIEGRYLLQPIEISIDDVELSDPGVPEHIREEAYKFWLSDYLIESITYNFEMDEDEEDFGWTQNDVSCYGSECQARLKGAFFNYMMYHA